MKFFFRYWKFQMKLLAKRSKTFYLIVAAFVLLAVCLHMIRIQNFDFIILIVCILLCVIAPIIPCLLCATIITLAHYSTARVSNTEGFSDRYLRLYEAKRIIGKPYNENNTVVFTEIMVRSGHPNEAMQYFNMIHISESNVFAYTALIYLKLLAGVKAGDPAYSDRVWQENQHFISSVTEKRNNAMSASFMFLGLVYTDCANGRYERALQQTVAYMNSKAFKRLKLCEFDFRIIHLFILKVLDREAFNNLAPKLKADIEANSFLYDWEKPQYLIDYNKAVNGVYPW